VLAGGQLFGFLGILLALPVAAALNVLVRHLHDRYRSSVLYGADERPVVAAKETADGAEAGDD
jgi:predicted PurR-regulated permease PerM